MSRPLRILIVEDHGATNQALAKMFGRRGYQVHAATTAAEAVTIARAEIIDVVISDIGLPDVDGWTLLPRLRALHPHLPAIAVSGFGYPTDRKRSEEAGFNVHLTKPATIEAIEAAMQSLLPNRGKKSEEKTPPSGASAPPGNE